MFPKHPHVKCHNQNVVRNKTTDASSQVSSATGLDTYGGLAVHSHLLQKSMSVHHGEFLLQSGTRRGWPFGPAGAVLASATDQNLKESHFRTVVLVATWNDC